MKFPLLTVCLFCCLQSVSADEPSFFEGFRLQNGSAPLAVQYYSSPTVVDWNNDGARDLVCGQEMYGNIALFLNQGTNINPVFQGSDLIESGGQPIAMTWS